MCLLSNNLVAKLVKDCVSLGADLKYSVENNDGCEPSSERVLLVTDSLMFSVTLEDKERFYTRLSIKSGGINMSELVIIRDMDIKSDKPLYAERSIEINKDGYIVKSDIYEENSDWTDDEVLTTITYEKGKGVYHGLILNFLSEIENVI